jgi:DNA-binding MarR family transcriptional regulator
LSKAEVKNLTDKTFRIIIGNGKDGILQSKLWKKLDLSSRNGSRLTMQLEKRSLIKREKILLDGRWTYRLFAVHLPASTRCIDQVPCLTCPVEHMCSVESDYSPNNCNLIEDWALLSFHASNNSHRQQQLQSSTIDHRKTKQKKEIILKEAKPTKHRTQTVSSNSKN